MHFEKEKLKDKTRKSLCVNARGILTATQQAHAMLFQWGGGVPTLGGGGVLTLLGTPPAWEGRYPPHPDLGGGVPTLGGGTYPGQGGLPTLGGGVPTLVGTPPTWEGRYSHQDLGGGYLAGSYPGQGVPTLGMGVLPW